MSKVVSEHYPPVVSWSSPGTSLPYHKQPRNSETKNWLRLKGWGGGWGGVGEGGYDLEAVGRGVEGMGWGWWLGN